MVWCPCVHTPWHDREFTPVHGDIQNDNGKSLRSHAPRIATSAGLRGVIQPEPCMEGLFHRSSVKMQGHKTWT